MQQENFDQWAIVELMGRQRIAGKVTERVIAGQGFLEVSVPETSHNPKFTRFISPSALYAINPLDEETAKAYAESLRVKPIDAWDINAFMKKVEEQRMLAQAKQDDVEYRSRMPEDDHEEDWREMAPEN